MGSKYMKKCLTSLIIREMQIKIIKSYYHTLGRMAVSKRKEVTSVGEDVEKRALFYTLVGM